MHWSHHAHRSELNRPETIEETAELVEHAGGQGIAVQVDLLDPAQVQALVARIESEQSRLDVLVNDVWGADFLIEWNVPELGAVTGDSKILRAAQSAQFGPPATIITLSDPLSTLDQLRAAALARQVKKVAPTLFSGSQADLARVWMAALVAGQ